MLVIIYFYNKLQFPLVFKPKSIDNSQRFCTIIQQKKVALAHATSIRVKIYHSKINDNFKAMAKFTYPYRCLNLSLISLQWPQSCILCC